MTETAIKTVKLFATLRAMAGTKTLDVPFTDGGTVRELVAALHAVHPEIGAKILDENGELGTVISIFVRGRSVEWLDGLDTVIRAEDDVLLVPPSAGG